MSEDIDFTEIDDLMAAMEGDRAVKKTIAAEVATERPVVKKKASKPKAAKKAPKKSGGEIVDVKVKSKPALIKPEIEHKPNPRTGHYMDLVHPMSDMATTDRPDRKAPPVMVVRTVAAGAISMVSPKVTDDITDDDINGAPAEEPQAVEPEDDILAEIIGEVDVVVDEKQLVEPDELDRLADELSYDDIETPFLENVKVEKRPLGGGAATEREIKLSELADAEEDRPVDGAKEQVADQEFISDKDHVEWAQEKQLPSKKPIKSLSKKKSHGALNVLLYVLLIILLVILGGAIGVLAYFSGLLEGLI